jgi:hypothetical protein
MCISMCKCTRESASEGERARGHSEAREGQPAIGPGLARGQAGPTGSQHSATSQQVTDSAAQDPQTHTMETDRKDSNDDGT